MAAKRNQHGLTSKQAKFASLLAQGYTQSGAYCAAYDAGDMKPETVWQEASRVAHDPRVAARVRELLEDARITDLDSAQRAFLDLLEDIESARSARNWTAVAALQRMRMQYHGLLKDRLVLSEEQSTSDEELIKTLADGDEAKAAVLRETLAPDGFRPLADPGAGNSQP